LYTVSCGLRASPSKTLVHRRRVDAHLSVRARVAPTSNPSRSLGDASGISFTYQFLCDFYAKKIHVEKSCQQRTSTLFPDFAKKFFARFDFSGSTSILVDRRIRISENRAIAYPPYRQIIRINTMTISMTETALDIEKQAMKRCAWRSPLRNWLIWIYCGMFLGSFTGFYVFWYTNMFRDYAISYLQLRNGTQVFNWWQELPFNFSYNIYIFNYTNVEDFEAGRASKLHVQELGPYMYSEKLIRMNMVMHQNGTLTYEQKKIYHWIGGNPADEVIVVPNVPLMFATALVRDLNFAMRFSLSTVLSTLHEKPFVNVTAGGYIWGYDNPLFEMAKPLLMLQRNILFDKFGLLAMVSKSLDANL